MRKRCEALVIALTMILTLSSCNLGNSQTSQHLSPPVYSEESTGVLEDVKWDYQYGESYLGKLKKTYELEKLVEDCTTELDKVQKVVSWVNGLWEQNGEKNGEGGPLYILEQVTLHGTTYNNGVYAQVINACLQSLGFTSRSLALTTSPEAESYHTAVEVYLESEGKWVFIDGQFAIIPMLEDTPLDGVEFGEAIRNRNQKLNLYLSSRHMATEKYYQWIEQYLYCFTTFYENDDKYYSLTLMPSDIQEPDDTIEEKSEIKYIDIYIHSKADFYLNLQSNQPSEFIPPVYSDEPNDILVNVDWFYYYDEAYLTTLKNKYKLGELVAGCDTDLDKAQKIASWVNSLWKHDGSKGEKKDPLYILEQVEQNGARYNCLVYARVIEACLQSIGIPSRTVGLKTADSENASAGAGSAHAVTEAYLEDEGKWVYIDGQFGVIPMLGKAPLNGVEFGEAIRSKYENLNLYLPSKQIGTEEYYRWVEKYLYYLDTSYEIDGIKHTLMLIPKGTPNPTQFEGVPFPPERGTLYTDSKKAFYPEK